MTLPLAAMSSRDPAARGIGSKAMPWLRVIPEEWFSHEPDRVWIAVVTPPPSPDPAARVWASPAAEEWVATLTAAEASQACRPAAMLVQELLVIRSVNVMMDEAAAEGLRRAAEASRGRGGSAEEDPQPACVYRRTAFSTDNARLGGAFGIPPWVPFPNASVAEAAAALNAHSEPAAALLLFTAFEGVLPSSPLMLLTLVCAPGVDASDPYVASHGLCSFGSFRPLDAPRPCTNARFACEFSSGGTKLRAAALAAQPPFVRARVESARRAQLLGALAGCARNRWTAGFLLLQPSVDAAVAGGDAAAAAAAALGGSLRRKCAEAGPVTPGGPVHTAEPPEEPPRRCRRCRRPCVPPVAMRACRSRCAPAAAVRHFAAQPARRRCGPRTRRHAAPTMASGASWGIEIVNIWKFSHAFRKLSSLVPPVPLPSPPARPSAPPPASAFAAASTAASSVAWCEVPPAPHNASRLAPRRPAQPRAAVPTTSARRRHTATGATARRRVAAAGRRGRRRPLAPLPRRLLPICQDQLRQ